MGKAFDRVLEYEWLVLVLIAYPMLFPSPATTPVMLVIPGLMILHWLREGRPLPNTPLNLPILMLSLMLLLSLWATYSIEYSLPKVSGLIFGIAVFFATVRNAKKEISVVMLFFLCCGIAVSGIGLFATSWPTKIPILNELIDRLPHVISRLPVAERGIHPNELGGVLLLFAPPCLWFSWCASRKGSPHNKFFIVVLWISAIWSCVLLFLTQSRSALLGFAAACGFFLISSGRYARLIFFLGAIAFAITLFIMGPGIVLGVPGIPSPGEAALGDVGFSARIEIWSRAIIAIEDYSFTGMGLGTFRRVAPVLYPFSLIEPERDIAHAHNLFLQTGLDFGIPGLVALLSIWIVVFIMLFRGFQETGGDFRPFGFSIRDLNLGLMGGVLAHFIFSITDAVAIGARPGFLLWMLLGMITAVYLKIP